MKWPELALGDDDYDRETPRLIGPGQIPGRMPASYRDAVTSIQDQTLTFVPKIVAILTIIGVFGAWMMKSMSNFTINLLNMIPTISG